MEVQDRRDGAVPRRSKEVLRAAGTFGYEVRTQPATLWLALVCLGLVAVAVVLPFTSGDLARSAAIGEDTILEGDARDAADELRDVYTAAGVAGLVAMLWAGITVAGARRHGTLITSVLASPRRLRLAAGIVLGAVLGGLAAGAVTAALTGASVPALARQADVATVLDAGEVAELLTATILHAGLSAAVGAGLGLLLGDQALTAVVVVAGFGLLGPVLSPLAGDLVELTPTGAADAMLGDGEAVLGGAHYALWALAAVTAGAWRLRTQDLL